MKNKSYSIYRTLQTIKCRAQCSLPPRCSRSQYAIHFFLWEISNN